MTRTHITERRAVVIAGAQVAIVAERMTPLKPDWVRVAVHFSGICHSDIAAIASGEIQGPVYCGHEASGVVVQSRAKGFKVGTRVIAYVGDGYASHVDVRFDRVSVIHDECSLLDAALAEPVACVIGALETLHLTDSTEVVVVGAGFMGLLCVRYLALLGHSVTVIEPIAERRTLARSAGAAKAIDPVAARDNYPDGAALVIEATGVTLGLDLASDITGIGGTLGILGYHQSDDGMRSVPMERWNFKGISVLSLHHRNQEQVMRWIDRAQRSAANGGIIPSAFVDVQFGLDDAAAGLTLDPESRSPVKALLAMNHSKTLSCEEG